MKRRAVPVVLVLGGALWLTAQQKPSVAVLDFRVSCISEADMRRVVSVLSGALSRTGRYAVVDVTRRETLLKEARFSVADCLDESCLLKADKALGSELLVVGELQRVGTTYFLAARIPETRTARCGGAVDSTYASLDALADDIQPLAHKAGRAAGKWQWCPGHGRPVVGRLLCSRCRC